MAEEIAVGKTKDFDMTFEQRERYLRETEKEEMRKRKQAEKSAYSRFAQQNIDRLDVLMKIADSPLATRIYLLIVKKMNQKNALVTSYQFFMEYFGVSKSSVRRAISLLESENILQIKRSGGGGGEFFYPLVVGGGCTCSILMWYGKAKEIRYSIVSLKETLSLQRKNGVITMKNNRILLPDGTFQERQYENALIMEHGYQERYEELLMNDTREGMVLAFIISKMDDENELVCSLDTIAQALHYSKASVARAIRLFRERYTDLVTIGKVGNTSRFTIDRNRCFKA